MSEHTKRFSRPVLALGVVLCAFAVVGLLLGAAPSYADDDDGDGSAGQSDPARRAPGSSSSCSSTATMSGAWRTSRLAPMRSPKRRVS